jgi:choline dehydrogenase-like flavoprotein
MTDHYDVIVIGSGAGGGTLTHALAPTGKRILLLDRGDFLPREPQNWDSKSVWVDLRYHNSGTWTRRGDRRGVRAEAGLLRRWQPSVQPHRAGQRRLGDRPGAAACQSGRASSGRHR